MRNPYQASAGSAQASATGAASGNYYKSPYSKTTTPAPPSGSVGAPSPRRYYSGNVGSGGVSSPAASAGGAGGMRRRGGGGGISGAGVGPRPVDSNGSGWTRANTKSSMQYGTGTSSSGGSYGYGGRSNPYSRVSNPYASTVGMGGIDNGVAVGGGYSNNAMSRPGGGGGGGLGTGMSQSFLSRRGVQNRLEDAKAVAQQFARIGQMTETLANIVEEQDIAIEDLETTTNEASDHIESGQNELLKLWGNVSNDRGLILKVFALLIFFIVLFMWMRR